LTADIRDLIQRDIPSLRGEPQLTALLEASVEENVIIFVHMLRHGIVTGHVEPPPPLSSTLGGWQSAVSPSRTSSAPIVSVRAAFSATVSMS
jgi:hypothetical protein